MSEIQRVSEHHSHGKDGANGVLEIVSALYLYRKDRNSPESGLNAPQSLALIYPARSLSYTLVTGVYIMAIVEDRSLTMNRFTDGGHWSAWNPAQTSAWEEPYASRNGTRLVAENIT